MGNDNKWGPIPMCHFIPLLIERPTQSALKYLEQWRLPTQLFLSQGKLIDDYLKFDSVNLFTRVGGREVGVGGGGQGSNHY